MRMIDAETLRRLLDYPSVIDALERMFREGATAPLRHHHTVPVGDGPDATLLLMPAWQQDRALGVKLATVFPGNADKGLPAVSAIYVLLDAGTGRVMALIDGAELTLWRTACASALAARALARPDAGKLLMIGTGALAPHLIRAHASVRRYREVMVWGRNRDKALALVRTLDDLPCPAYVAHELPPALLWADVVSAATLSPDPLVIGEFLKPGVHVDLVGGFTPAMREADDDAIAKATVFVDTRAGATKEAGDIVQPIAAGLLAEGAIRGDLFDIAAGRLDWQRAPGEITLFKSVGAALEDLAAARLAYEKATATEG